MYHGRAMKTRRVMLVLEVETYLPLRELRALVVGARVKGVRMLQVQANVIRAKS